jgi:predicted dehydrogenase
MNVAVIGVGSIGARRVRLLFGMGHTVYTVDPTGKPHWPSIQALADVTPSGVDAVFICTPPDDDQRLRTVFEALAAWPAAGLFVEKPVVTSAQAARAMYSQVAHLPNVTMGACNLRFAFMAARRKVSPVHWGGEEYGAYRMSMAPRFWSPTHTPISMILDSIHEVDLATFIHGPIEQVEWWSGIDAAGVKMTHKGGERSFVELDRFGDPPVRSVTIKGWSILHIDLYAHLAGEGVDAMYLDEMRYFLDAVASGATTMNPLERALLLTERFVE